MDLNDVIKGLHREVQWESQGVFTLDVSAGARKLSTYQLQRPSSWILKLVQAGVVSGSPHLLVSHSRESSTFVFASLEELNPDLVMNGLYDIQAPSKTYEYLSQALRALVGVERPFEVRIQNQQAIHRLVWDGVRTSRDQQARRGVNVSVVQVIAYYTGTELDRKSTRASEVCELQHTPTPAALPFASTGT